MGSTILGAFQPSSDGSAPERNISPIDLLVPAWALSLCIAHGLSLSAFPSFTPRMALLLMAGVPGLWVLLARQLNVRDTASVAAAVVVGWVLLSSVASDAPRNSFVGIVGREWSGSIALLALGVWAIGRTCSRTALRLLPRAVLLGLGINSLVGFSQVVFGVESGPFALLYSRATGLTPNPVYFGALMAAGAALASVNQELGRRVRLGCVLWFGLSANLSGSRVALAAGLLVIGVYAVRELRTSRSWSSVLGPTYFLIGVGLGLVVGQLAGARSSAERLGAGEGGGRLQAWRYGLGAIADRPIQGWGLGRFRAATQGRFSPEFVRSVASDDLQQAWFDAHNIVIELGVALGVIGLVVVGAWAFLASWPARGPLVAPLLVLGGVALLQPAGLAILPLGMLLLGAADAQIERPNRGHRPRAAGALFILFGVTAAGWLVISDLRLSAAVDDLDPAAIEDAAEWFPGDSVVADLVAQAWFLEEQGDESVRPAVLEWSLRAVDAEPDRPYFRAQLAARLVAFGELERAAEQVRRSLELQPWHVRTLYVAYVLGERSGDENMRAIAVARLCLLGEDLPECLNASDPLGHEP